jgi:hypothetical protein
MTTKDTAELLALKQKIEALSPADRLRLAASLIEQGKFAHAEVIAGAVVDEIRLLRFLDYT